MSNKTLLAACVLALLPMLAACDRGQGRDDTLADGATDMPTGGNTPSAAQDVGPPTPGANAAGPASGSGTAEAGAPGAAVGAPAAGGPTLTLVSQGAHGPHLADSAGNALYYAEGDKDGSKCVGDCLQAWPPVLATQTQPSGATGVQGGMIATITRPDGSRQVTYNGLPLYRYAADGGAGNTNGHGVKDKYATWLLVGAQGTPIAAGHAGH